MIGIAVKERDATANLNDAEKTSRSLLLIAVSQRFVLATVTHCCKSNALTSLSARLQLLLNFR